MKFHTLESTSGTLSVFIIFLSKTNMGHSHTSKCYCYRPQRSCEGYVFTGVCLSTRGGCLPQCMLGYHPPGADPPEQTPPPRADSHPPGADTHAPGADNPPGSRQPPSERQPPLRTVRILLECILVENMFGHMIFIPQYSVHSQGVPNVNF